MVRTVEHPSSRKSATRKEKVIGRLSRGPATNADLQEVLETHSADVSRLMAQMRHAGIIRVLSGRGRGRVAVYGLGAAADAILGGEA